MVGLLETYSLVSILIILIIAIPSIVSVISWCKKLWSQREKFKQDNIQLGKALEAQDEEEEARLTRDEERIKLLEDNLVELKGLFKIQQEQIALLIKSDELDIKSWIKIQHEKWMPRQCIDSQTLDLIEQRFEIYEKEGGNSWAKRLMKDLRSLPVVTIVPTNEMGRSYEDQ